MEYRAIGLVEVNSVAKGILCADTMLKAAQVDLIMARAACPGRYLAMITGDVGSVANSVDVGKDAADEFIVDSFVIPNVHPAVFPALSCVTRVQEIRALGIIETYSVASCISASDVAVKSAEVDLIEIRCATGLAGKSFVIMTGDVASVKSAVDNAIEVQKDEGLIQCYEIISSPSSDLHASLM